MNGRIGDFEIRLVSRRQLGSVSADADQLEWRIRTHHGLTVARSHIAFASAEDALADARRAVARLSSDVEPTPV